MRASKNHIIGSFLLIFALFFTACGYKPTAFYAKQELKKDVFVDLKVRVEDPQNSVLVKDSVTKILMQKIGSNMVDKKELAVVLMDLTISSVSFSTLSYDKDGYNKLYKANVVIGVKYFDKESKKTKNFTVDGEHDFVVDIGGTINDSHRFEAISKASDMAVTEILSKIAVASFK
jgi:hypothetical protein